MEHRPIEVKLYKRIVTWLQIRYTAFVFEVGFRRGMAYQRKLTREAEQSRRCWNCRYYCCEHLPVCRMTGNNVDDLDFGCVLFEKEEE